MKISKLELERFIDAYKDYRETDDTTIWLNNRTYLQDNDFKYLDLIEELHEEDFDKIVKVLEALGVEVV